MGDVLGVRIIQKDLLGDVIAEYKSIAEASEKTGISKGNICMVCKGKRGHAGKFKWEYKNN